MQRLAKVRNRMRSVTLFIIAGAGALMLAACGGREEQKSWTPVEDGSKPAAQAVAAASKPAPQATSAISPHAAMADKAAPPMGMGAGSGPMGMPEPPKVSLQATSASLMAAGITFALPEGWVQEKPANSMRIAQYRLPGAGGDGELVLSYLGAGVGGAAKMNVERWLGQFKSDDPTSPSIDVANIEQAGLKVFLVKTSGTYTPAAMGMAMGGGTGAEAPEPRKNHSLFGMVIEGGPEGTLFVKATGPKATIEAQGAKLESFARSAKPK